MNLRKLVAVALSVIFIVPSGCLNGTKPHMQQEKSAIPITQNAKQVILLMIDSLMDNPLQEAMNKGRAPGLQFLINHGQYFSNVVSSFPTMSVTIDSTLLTGTYADRHRVPGLVWYNVQEKRIVNYGNGIRDVFKLGPVRVFKDSLYELNNVHLSKQLKTIHEELGEKGKESASINALMYRGNTEHNLKIPDAISDVTPLPKTLTTYGPKWFSLGTVSQLNPANGRNTAAWQKYGINNKFSAEELKYLIQKGQLPHFSIVYFPDNDFTVHKKGPASFNGIEKTDKQLQEILNTFGSWEEAIKNNIWIVMGDSGQTAIGKDRNRSIINLHRILSEEGEQALICINERMAYIYTLDQQLPVTGLARRLQNDERIDLIAWKENGSVHVKTSKSDGLFSYRPNGKYIDEYNQSWSFQGEPKILDISVDKNRIHYGNYPDGMARLYGALHSHEGNYLIATAKPGFEFGGESSPTHPGGAGHGSMHKEDSLVPMIVTGTDTRPKYLRFVDVKDWILNIIG